VIPLRDENPAERRPIVTVVLIVANVAAFGWQLFVGLDLSVQRAGLIPYELLSGHDIGPTDIVPPVATILTSMFMHGGLLHIAGNMWFLWIFGDNVEDALGAVKFVLFYLACGVAAALAQTLASVVMGGTRVPMVGASGAIAGVLAGYAMLFPRARILTIIPFLFGLVYLPAWFFLGVWFLYQLLPVFLGQAGHAGVAFFAHIGGFLAGLALVKVLGTRRGFLART
jgi:membrane associated rhomboid family serine protease